MDDCPHNTLRKKRITDEQPIPRYDYASGKVEYVLRGLFYDSREEALACNKQRMPQMSGRREE
jgi:hypothetical protein